MYTIDNNTTAAGKGGNYLAGNQIHAVTFKGVKLTTITGKDKTEYPVIECTFVGEGDAVFVDNVFEPKGTDVMTRKANNFGGVNPSAGEELMFRLRHLIAAVNPVLDKQIEEGKQKLAASNWDNLRKLVLKATTPGIGAEVQIKLLKDANGFARFPGFVLSINKDGAVYPRTSYVGAKLAFTAKEVEKMAVAAAAKPTTMAPTLDSSIGDLGTPTGVESTEDEFNFNMETL